MPVRVDDGGGGFDRQDQLLATVWSDIRPATSKEVYQAQKLEMHITHVVVIRYIPTVLQGGYVKTVLEPSRKLYVTRVVDADNRRRFLTVWVREGGPV
jgi:SPP1 family predicted phage head-tail adaptor